MVYLEHEDDFEELQVEELLERLSKIRDLETKEEKGESDALAQ